MDCIFCKIASKIIPSAVVFEDDSLLAFRDINPVAPVHILIIPKKHIAGIETITENDNALLGRILNTARDLAVKENIDKGGYRVVINSGPDSGQLVAHLHFHLVGGRKGVKEIF
ncbi:MAG: histidine triad nucleotide-binding protein [Elusimicrobiota bacterium]